MFKNTLIILIQIFVLGQFFIRIVYFKNVHFLLNFQEKSLFLLI